MFPNEDDIPATLLYKDPIHNLAVLQLNNRPKVKHKQLTYSKNSYVLRSENVYTIGYPWANTMEDKHVLIKGSTSLSRKLDLIPITMPLNGVNSGGPLFNSNNELVGMVLFEKHAVDYYELERSKIYDYAIPVSTLIMVIKKLKLKNEPQNLKTSSKELFVESRNKNVVLIEAY